MSLSGNALVRRTLWRPLRLKVRALRMSGKNWPLIPARFAFSLRLSA
jgi:hypothetical protein